MIDGARPVLNLALTLTIFKYDITVVWSILPLPR
jgi:hypothetical protein